MARCSETPSAGNVTGVLAQFRGQPASNSHFHPERGCVVSTSRGTSAQIQALGVFVRCGSSFAHSRAPRNENCRGRLNLRESVWSGLLPRSCSPNENRSPALPKPVWPDSSLSCCCFQPPSRSVRPTKNPISPMESPAEIRACTACWRTEKFFLRMLPPLRLPPFTCSSRQPLPLRLLFRPRMIIACCRAAPRPPDYSPRPVSVSRFVPL